MYQCHLYIDLRCPGRSSKYETWVLRTIMKIWHLGTPDYQRNIGLGYSELSRKYRIGMVQTQTVWVWWVWSNEFGCGFDFWVWIVLQLPSIYAISFFYIWKQTVKDSYVSYTVLWKIIESLYFWNFSTKTSS